MSKGNPSPSRIRIQVWIGFHRVYTVITCMVYRNPSCSRTAWHPAGQRGLPTSLDLIWSNPTIGSFPRMLGTQGIRPHARPRSLVRVPLGLVGGCPKSGPICGPDLETPYPAPRARVVGVLGGQGGVPAVGNSSRSATQVRVWEGAYFPI